MIPDWVPGAIGAGIIAAGTVVFLVLKRITAKEQQTQETFETL